MGPPQKLTAGVLCLVSVAGAALWWAPSSAPVEQVHPAKFEEAGVKPRASASADARPPAARREVGEDEAWGGSGGEWPTEPCEVTAFASLRVRVVFDDEVIAEDLSLLRDDGVRHEVAAFHAGEFEFTVPAGRYVLQVRAPGAVPQQVEGIVLGAGEDIRGLEVTLRRGESIRGRVLVDGEPLAHEVVLDGQGYLLRAWSEEDGTFEFTGLVEGTYRVSAVSSGMGGDAAEVATGGFVVLELEGREVEVVAADARGDPWSGEEALHLLAHVAAPLDETPQHDPLGQLDHAVAVSSSWGSSEPCEELFADDDGRITFWVPDHAVVTVLGRAGELGGQVTAAPFESNRLELRLKPPRPVMLSVTGVTPDERVRDLIAVDHPSGCGVSFPEPTMTADGVVRIETWEGVETNLEVLDAFEVTPVGELPPTVTLASLPFRESRTTMRVVGASEPWESRRTCSP